MFDDSINCWNVESVTDMRTMVFQASNFNQPLGDWNVASVIIDMASMFNQAADFN